MQWLEPDTEDMIKKYSKRPIVLVPIKKSLKKEIQDTKDFGVTLSPVCTPKMALLSLW